MQSGPCPVPNRPFCSAVAPAAQLTGRLSAAEPAQPNISLLVPNVLPLGCYNCNNEMVNRACPLALYRTAATEWRCHLLGTGLPPAPDRIGAKNPPPPQWVAAEVSARCFDTLLRASCQAADAWHRWEDIGAWSTAHRIRGSSGMACSPTVAPIELP